MKHLFILNPKAGKKDCTKDFKKQIEEYFNENPGKYEIVLTEYPGHAAEISEKAVKSGVPHRIYAFGGDGTLNETVNGMGENSGCAVGVYPCGSGNDYVRIFPEYEKAGKNIERLIKGKVKKVDLMRVNGSRGVNEASAGFDADIANHVVLFKRWFGGHAAYMLSLFWCFLRRVSYPLEAEIDGKHFSGEYVFAAGCVGRYYGGGFQPTPLALPDDGLLDFMLVKKVRRLKLLSLIGVFKKGKHIGLTHLVTYIQGKKMTIKSKEVIPSTVDGQPGSNAVLSIETMPQALDLILPVCQNE